MFKVIDFKNGKPVVNQELEIMIPEISKFIKTYGEKANKWIAYLHYKHYPVKNDNPFYNLSEVTKDREIRKILALNKEEEPKGLDKIEEIIIKIYETPTIRFFNSYKKVIDKLSEYMNNMEINNDNIKNLVSLTKEYDTIMQTYKASIKNLEEELNSNKSAKLAYDQKM